MNHFVRNCFLVSIASMMVAMVPSVSMAQMQKGQVRTLERPNKKSQGLGGVVITVQEAPNSVLSSAQGSFSFSLPGKKEGDSYTVLSVQKNNYALVDKGIRGRKFGYSSKAALEIVMVSRQQLEEEKHRIEDSNTARALREYNKQKDELETLRREKRISEETYAKRQLRLGDDFEKFMSLIDKMAEMYALFDYKNISDLNRQIAEAIENAELEKAESLIKTKGDFDQREKQVKETMEMGRQQVAMGEKTMQEGIAQMNDLAQDYFRQHTILMSNYKFDEAATFLERRAALDSTNASWQLELATFVGTYLSDYERAEKCATKAMQTALMKDGANSQMVAYCLNDMGNNACNAGFFDKALDYYWRSLDIRRHVFGEQSEETAKCYSNMAVVYKHKDMLDSARVYYEKALQIRQSSTDDDCCTIALSYIDMGQLERTVGDAKKALEYYQMALPLISECKGENSEAMAELCNALAGANTDVDSLDAALGWYEKALDIEKKLYGEEHPMVATILNNMGVFFSKLRYYKQAYELHSEALQILVKTLGKTHPEIAHNYNNVASALCELGKIDEALDYSEKALQLDMLFFGEKSSAVAMDYCNLGTIYVEKKQTEKALELEKKALDIYTDLYGEHSGQVARIIANIADIYLDIKDYQKAIDYNLQTISIYKSLYGERHSRLIKVYNNLSEVYSKIGDYQKQLEYLQYALNIACAVYGEESPNAAIVYSNIGTCYYYMKDYEKAIEYFQKSNGIYAKCFGKDDIKAVEGNLGLVLIYQEKKEYAKAIEACSEYVRVARSVLGENDRSTISYSMTAYSLFHSLLAEAPNAENQKLFQQFMADKSFVVLPVEGGVASKKGMKDECRLLQYFDWRIDSDTTACFFSTVEKYRQDPKRMVVADGNGMIKEYVFEEATMGVQFLLKFIDSDKKQALIKMWQQNRVY